MMHCVRSKSCVLALQLTERVENGSLVVSFLHAESRFAKVLRTFPLFLVKDTGLGIRGAIAFAANLIKDC